MNSINRRTFLRQGALRLGGLYLGLQAWPQLAAAEWSRVRTLDAQPANGPFAEVSGPFASTAFSGDEYRHPHDLLWHIDEYVQKKGGRPTALTAEVDTIIVGGGISGLLAAYQVRDKNWMLFEQASRLGGNAKSETFQGAAYSLGPAYVTVPEPGSSEEKFLRDTGLLAEARHEAPEEARVLFGGLRNLWDGSTDPAARADAARMEETLRRIYEDAFPEIPLKSGGLDREALAALDRQSAADWLRAQGNLHPHLVEYFQLYCWSSFGGSLDELSAAQFLNFVASETKGVLAFPGGNGAIARRLHEILLRSPAGEARIRSSTLVLEVKEAGNGVEVLVEAADGTLQLHRARAVVVAAPKYVARMILRKSLDSARDQLWNELPYRAYAVANVLLKEKITSPAFDLYCLRGAVPDTPSFGRRTDRPVTDLIFGNWADRDASGPTVLTAYRPYPLDGARNFLMGPNLHERVQKEIGADIAVWLGQLGYDPGIVAGIRLSLWGHSVPLAQKGLFASGALERIGAPLGARIFFANQDNYMNPSFESCLASAEDAGVRVRQLLG